MESVNYGGKEYVVKYQHNRVAGSCKGGKTVAYISEDERDDNGKFLREVKMLYFATARCSERDGYSRKIGRKIAFGRLKKEIGELDNGKVSSEPKE
jgi:hypothetical protein